MLRYLPAGTGAAATVGKPVTVVTDIGHLRHDDWIVLDVTLGRRTHAETVRWAATAELGLLPLAPATARALGRLPDVPVVADPSPAGESGCPVGAVPIDAARPPAVATRRRQRFAVYALATDPAGRVLLTRISDGYPGAGHWHLPGGGTDAGESASAGLLRELIEETDQRGRLGEPLSLSHRHQRDAMGPEGVPIDWQGIRVVYRVHIDAPTPARVTEGAGSTVEAGWFAAREAVSFPLTEVARDSIQRHLR
jgi:8-oxo-dGTP diphosphatase